MLMAEGRPVPNPELENLGPSLKKGYRDRLKNKQLIDVLPGRPMKLELIDKGYELCAELIGTEPPMGVRGQNKALYALMKGLRRYSTVKIWGCTKSSLPAKQARLTTSKPPRCRAVRGRGRTCRVVCDPPTTNWL